jgi:hypothetical protein
MYRKTINKREAVKVTEVAISSDFLYNFVHAITHTKPTAKGIGNHPRTLGLYPH